MKTQILVIGRHVEIMHTVLRLINQNENWEAKGALEDAEAYSVFISQHFDLVLLGGGIASEDEQKFKEVFTQQQPHIKIIQHFGGGSGLLFSEIYHALTN